MESTRISLRVAGRRSSLVFRRMCPTQGVTSTLRRAITNATVLDYVLNPSGVPKFDSKPGDWHPTLIQSSGEGKMDDHPP
jgi:hypothetical protein